MLARSNERLTDHQCVCCYANTGLCRLSNLLLEDRRTQRVYRLERPLEIYVTSFQEEGEKGAATSSVQ